MIKRIYYFFIYLGVFTKALVVANIQVAITVLSPTLRIRPGFVAMPLRVKTDLEITSLANSITLTPGTIAVHITNDRKTLVIHALDVGPDPDLVRKDIQATLEDNILRWSRPPAPGSSVPGSSVPGNTPEKNK